MWTGLVCLGWLKQRRSNLGHVLLSTLQAQAGQPAMEKPSQEKRCSSSDWQKYGILHPSAPSACLLQASSSPSISTPCSAQALAGRWALLGLVPGPAAQTPAGAAAAVRGDPLPVTPAHAGLGDHTRHSERLPSKVSGCAFDTSTALPDRDAVSVGRAAVTSCQDWLPFR